MKTIVIAGLLLTGSFAAGQEGEFPVHTNGLIYSEATMSKLTRIVDSLNIRYKRCEFNKQFYAWPQTIGHVLHLDTGDIAEAVRLMDAGSSPDDIILQFPGAEIQRDQLILKFNYELDGQQVVQIEHIDPVNDNGMNITSTDLSLMDRSFKQTWYYERHPKTEYSDEYITAFYFPGEFRSLPLPATYAGMIVYSDCLIDTNTTKFLDNAKPGSFSLPADWRNLPLRKKRKLLKTARSTRVIGFCSMDQRPREHARDMALLAAESVSWEVFLRAHLDIMNDRFDRMSDGNYAWGPRGTYIRELETLGIDVRDLLLGTCLRVSNPATNHYFGSIPRISRALAEAQDRDSVEAAILAAVTDDQLDDFNRLLFYWLYRNYTGYLKNESLHFINKAKLNSAVGLMPLYLRAELRWE